MQALVLVPDLVRQVRELQTRVESLEGRSLRCQCGSTEFSTTTTRRTDRGVKRWKRCRACDARITTYEVIA